MRIKILIKKIRRKIVKFLFYDLFKEIDNLDNKIEYREFNRRFYAIKQAAEYLLGAQVNGDYCEFGVYKGTTFTQVFKETAFICPNMKYYAFDSFKGLPEIKGIDNQNGYTSNFTEKEFACNKNEFIQNISKQNVQLSRVVIIEGWFDQTLNEYIKDKYALKTISFAWIDCDLYESTVPVLSFITPLLQTGSLIIFDDWHCFRNHPEFGQQRACKEWLVKNPETKLNELFSFGWHGMAFTVEKH